MAEPVRSVLYEVQAAAGATFRDEHGWLWTESIGSDLAGYAAVRDGLAIWDIYPLVKWSVSGPDAMAAIQRVCTADLGRQRPGTVRYGAFTAADGTLVDDGTIFMHSATEYWICTNSERAGEHLAEHATGLAVTVSNRTRELPLISAQGPLSPALVQSLTPADLSGLRYYTFLPERVPVAGVPTWVMRTGFSGERGYELIPDPDGAVTVWNALLEAGGVPFGLTVLEPVRVEAGLIIYDVDYVAGQDTPYDISLDAYVRLGSGADFLGREALAAIAAAPPRRLKTLRISGGELPEPGAAVLADGEVIGEVTSPAVSPRMGPLALAKIATAHAADGGQVEVVVDGGTAAATIDVLSVKDPAKLRARAS